MCQGERVPASLTFFDLQAAFYQVLRQALVPPLDTDEELLKILHALGLPSAAVSELKDKLYATAQLPLLGATSHAVAVVQDLFRGTWFRLSGFSALTLTKRGSRPGDPTADLLFGFTMSALAKSVHTCLESRGLLPSVPSASHRPCFVAESSFALGLPSWADDFVSPQTGASWVDLIARTSQALTVVVDLATSAGMTIKCGRDKTAVLFPPAALRSPDTSFCEGPDGQRSLALRNSITQEVFEVPVVEAYRHLGGIVTSTGTPTPDLHFRFAQAFGTLRPLRRRLFGAREFPLHTRAYLLRSLVVSKFAHSAAALLLPSACQIRVWEQHYMSLWRALFHRRSASAQLHSFRVLHEAHALPPHLALAQARAGFLKRVHLHGPSELLLLLWDHWAVHPASSWYKQVLSDVGHVSQYVPSVRNLLSTGDTVAALLESFAEDPFWWPRQIKAASRAFFEDVAKW
ncbi:tyrP-A, partial [Symbiodinium necroappetens]